MEQALHPDRDNIMKIGNYKFKCKQAINTPRSNAEWLAMIIIVMFICLFASIFCYIIVYVLASLFALVGWAVVSCVSIFMSVPDITFWAYAGVGFAVGLLINVGSKLK
jgi:hypothetical protein